MNRIEGGLLVAVEGIDGAGKTSLVASLDAHFRLRGVDVVSGKEPTQGPWGQKLRDTAHTGRISPQEELEYLLLDRRQHVEQVIEPTLKRGGIMLLDRYYFSNAAYQGAAGLDPYQIIRENETFAPRPDVTILLDLDPRTGLERIRLRGDQANAFEREDSLISAREIFLATLPEGPAGAVVDASKSVKEVFDLALGLVLAAAANRLVASSGATPEALKGLASLMDLRIPG